MDKNELINNKIITERMLGYTYPFPSLPITSREFPIALTNDGVEIGDYVAVIDSDESVTIGKVSELISTSDSDKWNVVKKYVENPKFTDPVKKLINKIAIVTIINRIFNKEGALMSVNAMQPVHEAGYEGIKKSLELKNDGIIAGLLAKPSRTYSDLVVKLTPSYLLGPEAAHLNVCGQSGFGKTSFVIMLLKSLLTWSNASGKKIGVVVFNVKKDDFLYLDIDNDELDDEDRKIYEKMNIEAAHLDNVVFYATRSGTGSDDLATLRSEPLKTKDFFWSWNDVKGHIEHAVSANEAWDDIQEHALQVVKNQRTVTTFREVFTFAEECREREAFNIRAASWGKFLRIIRGIYASNSGLLASGSKPIDYVQEFDENDVIVIDVNERFFKDYTQRLIIGKIVDDVRKLMETDELGLDHLVIVMDELGKYAKKVSSTALRQIRSVIQDIVERGRSIKISLFGIEQYASMIADEIIGNTATNVISKTKTKELSTSSYSTLKESTKSALTRLQKGLVMLQHDPIYSEIFIRVPRAPCAQKLNSGKRKKIKKDTREIHDERVVLEDDEYL